MSESLPTRKSPEGANELVAEIREKRKLLEEQHVVAVDMHISSEERSVLDGFNIEKDSEQFDFYGETHEELIAAAEQYLFEAGVNTSEDITKIAQLVRRLADGMRAGFETDSAWTMLRVSLPNTIFDVPRWHPDGRYFAGTEKSYKMVAALKGPSTLFGQVTDEKAYKDLEKQNSENFDNFGTNRAKFNAEDARIREELSRVVTPIEIAKPGEAVIYLVGDPNAPLHSEPAIKVPRIFLSVLPGSFAQIEEWRARN